MPVAFTVNMETPSTERQIGVFANIEDANDCAEKTIYDLGFHPRKLESESYLRTDESTGGLYMVEDVKGKRVWVEKENVGFRRGMSGLPWGWGMDTGLGRG